MTDKAISGLTELAEQAAIADMLELLDVSDATMGAGGTNKKHRMDRVRGYVLAGAYQKAAFSPADATTYYFGSNMLFGPDTSANVNRIYVPRSGQIARVRVNVRNTSVDGTAETSSMWLRKNNTTDYLLSNAITTNGFVYYINSAQAIDVIGSEDSKTADYVEFKWTTPTWVTNPSAIVLAMQILVQ